MNRIREVRKALGLKQVDLARQLHVSQSTISAWETRPCRPPLECLYDISLILGVDLDYLTCHSNDPKPPKKIDDRELACEILNHLREVPEMRALFKLAKKANREHIEKTIQIMQILVYGEFIQTGTE